MNRRAPNKLFFLSLLIPVAVLCSMLMKPLQATTFGDEVVLATIPIDPRDLFYGDYVILDLEIDQVEETLLDEELRKEVHNSTYENQITVYVLLKEGSGGIYTVDRVSKDRPEGIFIKGKMEDYLNEDIENQGRKFVHIHYGLDRFYVEEGTGLELEEQAREGKVLVSVKIYNGYALLTNIKGVKYGNGLH
ncbi:GDYXXLXY domain-containing protein [Bacillus sp. 31A1R]|uniref:GDYXXLXY domain-containing protein n=1 Tax=Robertmurraya mangrovi TaxID=3098077 RepID=A0ABU5IZA8_9BACI|nr:GDYXXLXY domain-containing protein [Bacillus sp. 31A1R]MDZ5472456.1 GDYXXLXY domain-containing protein [Bacillus sp. 31A1R]